MSGATQVANVSNPRALPSEILQRITDVGGSRVVLVVGAGVSMESPTNFRSGTYYSNEAHRRLIADGVLDSGDCEDPGDLSVLAEAVYEKHGSQKELTSRLPKDAWRTAAPNSGHLIAAALLLEGALHHVISLNYDLAFQNAITELGNSRSVSFIEGPTEHPNIGAHSVVYLHRSVNQDEETWVLRKTALESEWESEWESVIAAANLAAPLVIFVGLGSPAKVLTESVSRLAAKANSSYYLVDRNLDTQFADALGDNLTGSVQLYWGEFMAKLANRVVNEQLQHIREACEHLLWEQPDFALGHSNDITAPLSRVELVNLGRARSAWLLEAHSYSAEGDVTRHQHVAHLLLGLERMIVALESAEVELDSHGRFTFVTPDGKRLVIGLAHGKGMSSWAAISTKIRERNQALAPQLRTGTVVVAGARPAGNFKVDDLVREDTAGDLIRGADTLHPIFVDDFLSDPTNDLKAAVERIMK